MRISNVLSGWINYLSDKQINGKGLSHCMVCDHAVEKKYLTFVKDDFKEVQGKVCDKCDCPLSAKLRSPNEKCPLEKW